MSAGVYDLGAIVEDAVEVATALAIGDASSREGQVHRAVERFAARAIRGGAGKRSALRVTLNARQMIVATTRAVVAMV